MAVPCLASSLVSLFLTLHFPFIMSQRDRSDITIKELELEAESTGQVVQVNEGVFSGQVREVGDADTLEANNFNVTDTHVHNWVISGRLTNAIGHVEAPATPEQPVPIGGV